MAKCQNLLILLMLLLPPEADIIRAIYEGLNDLDAITLEPKSAVAGNLGKCRKRQGLIFKKELRQMPNGQNGETVTAKDFEKSWKRLILLNEKVLKINLKNIQAFMICRNLLESEEIISTKPANSNKVESKTKTKPNQIRIKLKQNTKIDVVLGIIGD